MPRFIRLTTRDGRPVHLAVDAIVAVGEPIPSVRASGVRSWVWTRAGDDTFDVAETVLEVLDAIDRAEIEAGR